MASTPLEGEIVAPPAKNVGGRPLKFASPELLQRAIDGYFDTTPDNKVTITGLAVYLDTDRTTLINYQNRDGYFDIVKRAKNRVEASYELSMREHGRTTDIFALKQFGWTDAQQVDLTSQGERVIIYRPRKLDDSEV